MVKEEMALRLKSAERKKIYRKRKETVELVLGIIKQREFDKNKGPPPGSDIMG
jgi:hypothetical protein